MDFHGNIDLRNNEMQKLVFEQESSFPVDAVVGSVVFNDKKLYMAVALNNTDPIWIPLTQSISSYIHEQNSTATTWTVTHSLGTEDFIVQVYDENRKLIIPDSVGVVSNLELTLTFGAAVSGRAIVMYGDEIPANGVGILEPSVSVPPDLDGVTLSLTKDVIMSDKMSLTADMFMSPDGTKIFMAGQNNISLWGVQRYSMSIPWDISTASHDQEYIIPSLVTIRAIYFNSTGTKLYTAGTDGVTQKNYEYDLSAAYDVSAPVFNGEYTHGQESNIRGLIIQPDGSSFYMLGQNADEVFQWNMTVPYDITTGVYSGLSVDTLAQIASPYGLFIDSSGTKMHIGDITGTDKIYQYTLSSPWVINTATYDTVNVSVTDVVDIGAIFFGDNNTKLYVAEASFGGDPVKVYQYDL